MPPHLSAHEPLLVNLLGHSAGALIYGIFLVLLWRDRSGWAPRAAAALALIWNLCSLIVLLTEGVNEEVQQGLVVVATSALSLLPALLLEISLEGRLRWATRSGYLLSGIAVALHTSELWMPGTQLHTLALVVTAAGFALLTLAAMGVEFRQHVSVRRAAAAMALVLFALSFSHFHAAGSFAQWPYELLLHHAGIPLALFVLLQDYRFVLLDAFLRFLTNILLAGLFVFGISFLMPSSGMGERERALLLLAGCVAFVLFGLVRSLAQRLLTSLLFRPDDPARVVERLRRLQAADVEEFAAQAAAEVAAYFGASVCGLEESEVRLRIRTGEGQEREIGLSRRNGGRRYLSEDLDLLSRFSAEIALRLDAERETELKRLVTQAELRALQSQIHPHFLFNALNTLYGLIPREAGGARQTVLDLSDILRFFFRTRSAEIPLEEEIRIVKAYLAIEALRLGHKLNYEVEAPEETLRVPIPVLSLQPLVENAVRHGVAASPRGGRVSVKANLGLEGLRVSVEDDGPGFPAEAARDARQRVGLENVKKRLRLRYGAEGGLRIDSAPGRTVVSFLVPAGENG
jgi:hypothetical protein